MLARQVAGKQYPWLGGVKVDALDSLGPSKQLPLEIGVEISHPDYLNSGM